MQSSVVQTGAAHAVMYPNGWRHYALGSPDGDALRPGQPLTILLAGHQIMGVIHASSLGDYLRAKDGTACGLCAGMRVVAARSHEQKAEVAR